VAKLEKEFLTLEAGNMSHKEYTTKYNEMALLFPDLVKPEEKRIKRYVQGLPIDIRRGVMTTRMSTFRSVVALSGALYEQRDVVRSLEQKKGWVDQRNNDAKRFKHDSSGSSVKKARFESRDTKGGNQGGNNFKKSGNNHSGNYPPGDTACFRCGKTGHLQHVCPDLTCYKCRGPGHLASNCTTGKTSSSDIGKALKSTGGDKPRAKARAFNISRKEAEEQDDVVSGTLIIRYCLCVEPCLLTHLSSYRS
jgi:hypothetical protein